MRPFAYVRARTTDEALNAGRGERVRYLAGGTNLVDLMRIGVEEPAVVVDITALPLAAIEPTRDGLRIGALARNTEVAWHPEVVSHFPALALALRSGASPQLRNMATVGGNLLQRTRCPYFRDGASPCNKRAPGSGCAAWDGYNRSHAILGGGPRCIATHPSDMCVALAALDARVLVRGPAGERAIPLTDFHLAPVDRPEIETALAPGELVTHVELPHAPWAARSTYVKVRDRASFAFALASAAVGLQVEGGTIRAARVAIGGATTKPWRSHEAESALLGKPPSADAFRAAAAAAVEGAVARAHNAFKVELVRRTVVRALETAGGLT